MATSTHSRATETLRRRFHRLPVIWAGRLDRKVDDTDCTILNVSPGGAKLQIADYEPCPARVTLQSPRFGELKGRVVWRRNDLVGLAFLERPSAVADAMGGLLGEPMPI